VPLTMSAHDFGMIEMSTQVIGWVTRSIHHLSDVVDERANTLSISRQSSTIAGEKINL
jgi:hypothetical protein